MRRWWPSNGQATSAAKVALLGMWQISSRFVLRHYSGIRLCFENALRFARNYHTCMQACSSPKKYLKWRQWYLDRSPQGSPNYVFTLVIFTCLPDGALTRGTENALAFSIRPVRQLRVFENAPKSIDSADEEVHGQSPLNMALC